MTSARDIRLQIRKGRELQATDSIFTAEVFNWTLKIAVLRVTGRKIRENDAVRQLPGADFNPHDVIPRLTVRVRWIS